MTDDLEPGDLSGYIVGTDARGCTRCGMIEAHAEDCPLRAAEVEAKGPPPVVHMAGYGGERYVSETALRRMMESGPAHVGWHDLDALLDAHQLEPAADLPQGRPEDGVRKRG